MPPLPPEEKKGSVFTSASRAASGLKDGVRFPPGYHLLPALAYAGCHDPLFAATSTNITDKALAEQLGKAIGNVLTQAAEDAGHPEIRVASVVWLDKQLGTYKLGMAAGTATKEAPKLTEFPAQKVIASVGKLRAEMIGTGPDNISPQWDLGAVEEEGKGLVTTYRWDATNDRQKKLQGLMLEIIKVQGAHYLQEEDGPNPILRLPKEDLERLAGYENKVAPPLP